MPTLKQIELAKKVVENVGTGRSLTELMEEAGYAPPTARAAQKRIMQGLGFVEILNKAGATDKFIADKLMAGLKAKNGKKADLYIRLQYIDRVMKSKGLLRDSIEDQSGSLENMLKVLKNIDFEVLIHMKQKISSDEQT